MKSSELTRFCWAYQQPRLNCKETAMLIAAVYSHECGDVPFGPSRIAGLTKYSTDTVTATLQMLEVMELLEEVGPLRFTLKFPLK